MGVATRCCAAVGKRERGGEPVPGWQCATGRSIGGTRRSEGGKAGSETTTDRWGAAGTSPAEEGGHTPPPRPPTGRSVHERPIDDVHRPVETLFPTSLG